MHPLLRFCALASLFLAWNLPNHYPPLTSFHGELMAAIGLVLLMVGLAAAERPTVSPRASAVGLTLPAWALALAALACVPLLQWFAGQLPFRADAVFGLVYGMGAALAIYVGHLWAARVGYATVLLWLCGTVLAGALAAFGVGLAQWLDIPIPGWWVTDAPNGRSYGNLGQPNHFGLLMVLGIVAATALFEMRAVRRATVLGLAVALLGFGILLSQSRASALALLSVVACWLLTRARTPTRLHAGPVIGAVALWLLLFAQWELVQHLVAPSASLLRDRTEAGVRPDMWRHFWAAILASPWQGYGFNQGVAALAEVATQLPLPTATRATVYAHNFVLDFAVWAGLPVAVAMVAALAWSAVHAIRPVGDVALWQLRHVVLAGWLALALQSLLEYPYAYSYFLLPLCLMAGAVLHKPVLVPFAWVRPSRTAQVMGAATFALLGAIVWDYAHLEEDFRQARFARYNFEGRPAHEFYDAPLVLDWLATMHRTVLRTPTPGMPQQHIEEARAVARRVQEPAVAIDYAKVLAMNGRMDEARHELAVLRGLYSPELYASIEDEWKAWLAKQHLQYRPDVSAP